MSRTVAIASREFRTFFLSPGGYVIVALFLVLVGIFFTVRTFDAGQPSSMRAVFDLGTWLLMFVCPAITMRAISEERRLGTYEMLMTSPLNEAEVVLGKFLGAMGFLGIMLLPTALHVVVLEIYGSPDYGELACGYLGLLLAGAAYLASGILVSALTVSQVVAFLVTLLFWMTLSFGTRLLPAYVAPYWADLIVQIDPGRRLGFFAIGLLDTAGVVYFLSMTACFLIAAAGLLSWRRWP